MAIAPLIVDAGTRVAILAGGGELPLLIADHVRGRGGSVHIVAIDGEADDRIKAYPHTLVNYAKVNRMIRALRGASPSGFTRNVMVIAGAVRRPDILSLRPDLGLLRVGSRLLRLITAGGDDAILTHAIRILESEGLTVVGVQDIAPNLLIGTGHLGRHEPDVSATQDLDLARDLIDAVGDLDIGQAVVVNAGRVLAIEGVEGTDRMLARVARLGAAARGAVLLKAPKPRQERRVDLPTIGVRTIDNVKAAGIRGIGTVAHETLGLQRHEMIDAADRAGVFVVGLPQRDATTPAPTVRFATEIVTRRRPSAGDLADVLRGAEAVSRLATCAGDALAEPPTAAVLRGHILGVTAADPPTDLIERARRLAPWGIGMIRRRSGAIVMHGDPNLASDRMSTAIHEASARRFAAIGLVLDAATPIDGGLAKLADAAQLSLVIVRSRT